MSETLMLWLRPVCCLLMRGTPSRSSEERLAIAYKANAERNLALCEEFEAVDREQDNRLKEIC